MKQEKILVQLAGVEDSRGVYDIRYESTVNAVSENQAVVDFEAHDAWFRKQYFGDAKNKCFVLKVDNAVAGYCRFDENSKAEFNISIAILPKFQGMGFGKKLLSESMAMMGNDKVFIASIFKNNAASLKLFQKIGIKCYVI